tara:strand:+ start:210 stop:770 length:561 start_codon:yes stop_codon:yes gene_type:complete
MSNFNFATIDSSKSASLKQIFAIASRFTPIAAKKLKVSGVTINKILRPRITASLQSLEPSHGQIQTWFKSTTVPKEILSLIKTEGLDGKTTEPTAKAKPKASKKVKPKAKAKPKAAKQDFKTPVEQDAPKQAVKSDVVWKTTSKGTELEQRLVVLEALQSQQTEDIQTIKTGMEALLSALNGGLNS